MIGPLISNWHKLSHYLLGLNQNLKFFLILAKDDETQRALFCENENGPCTGTPSRILWAAARLLVPDSPKLNRLSKLLITISVELNEFVESD